MQKLKNPLFFAHFCTFDHLNYSPRPLKTTRQEGCYSEETIHARCPHFLSEAEGTMTKIPHHIVISYHVNPCKFFFEHSSPVCSHRATEDMTEFIYKFHFSWNKFYAPIHFVFVPPVNKYLFPHWYYVHDWVSI